MPISAILFGGRRANAVPLVTQSLDWEHGVFLGASVSSETTAAATGKVGVVRRDPFAMLPFCGYNMADYFEPLAAHGRRRGQAAEDLLRQLVPQGRGRPLAVAGLRRQHARAQVGRRTRPRKGGRRPTPIGWLPDKLSIDVSGTKVTETDLAELLDVDAELWKAEAEALEKLLGAVR